MATDGEKCIMTNQSDQPEYNSKYHIVGNPSIFEKEVEFKGDNVGSKYVYNYLDSDEALRQKIPDLQQFIAALEAQYPHLRNETEAEQVVGKELSQVQDQNPDLWNKLRAQASLLKRQLLNPERHLQATKAMVVEVTKAVWEKSLIVKAIITYLDKLSETPDQGI